MGCLEAGRLGGRKAWTLGCFEAGKMKGIKAQSSMLQAQRKGRDTTKVGGEEALTSNKFIELNG
jgi:hypothetical protein